MPQFVGPHVVPALSNLDDSLWVQFFTCTPLPCVLTQADTSIIWVCNDRFAKWVGLPSHDILGRSTVELGLWPNAQTRQSVCAQVIAQGLVEDVEVSGLIFGRPSTVLFNSQKLLVNGAVCLLSYLVDITRRKEIETQLRLAHTAIEQAAEAIVVLDSRGRILQSNAAFTEITGFPASSVVNQPVTELLRLSPNPKVQWSFSDIVRHLGRSGRWDGDLEMQSCNGAAVPVRLSLAAVGNEPSRPTHYVGVFTDITQRKAYEETLRHQALHDALTGLPNRTLLHEHLDHALARFHRLHKGLAVLFIDLDLFKQANDTYGHDVGDGLLVRVAERLKSCLRGADLVARLGGDEFVVVLEDVDSAEHALAVARKVLASLDQPYVWGAEFIHLGASIGVAICPDHGQDAAQLINKADHALYLAKENGRGQIALCVQPENNHGSVRRSRC